MKSKNIFFIIIAIVVLGGAIGVGFTLGGEPANDKSDVGVSNVVSQIGDKQVIDITAKGGYTPRVIDAKANIATTLRVSTNGTYDCSSSLVIPKLGWRGSLEPTGVKEIAIVADQAKGTMQGLCGMGMYSFKINFN
ncbi:MAG: hypothetical protein C3F02_02875 [Parcubacteria group bacterium]|nr:MAG: hypothetical protein C3F02_02875 [Parcubacteria group bacterium]